MGKRASASRGAARFPAKENDSGASPFVSPRSPFAVLGVSRDASAAQVKQAYRRLCARYHPDIRARGNATEKHSESALNSLPSGDARIDAAAAFLVPQRAHHTLKNRYARAQWERAEQEREWEQERRRVSSVGGGLGFRPRSLASCAATRAAVRRTRNADVRRIAPNAGGGARAAHLPILAGCGRMRARCPPLLVEFKPGRVSESGCAYPPRKFPCRRISAKVRTARRRKEIPRRNPPPRGRRSPPLPFTPRAIRVWPRTAINPFPGALRPWTILGRELSRAA